MIFFFTAPQKKAAEKISRDPKTGKGKGWTACKYLEDIIYLAIFALVLLSVNIFISNNRTYSIVP